QVGGVDLEDVPGEDDLGVLSGPGDDRLHLVRGEVLRFVNDEDDVREAAAADVGQGDDVELFGLHQLVDFLVFAVALGELIFDDPQIVPERLHEGIDLRQHVTGEEADVAIRKGNDRPGEVDLPVLPALLQGSGQGEQGLAGAGGAGEGDEGDVRIGHRVQGEGLLGVAR